MGEVPEQVILIEAIASVRPVERVHSVQCYNVSALLRISVCMERLGSQRILVNSTHVC